MKIAHLILAHNHPQQLEQLVNRLAYADDAVFIHLDKKTAIEPFLYLKNLKNVFLVANRVSVKWGAYSMIEATLNGFNAITSSGTQFDFVNLLSGCDYPLQTPLQIHQFFSKSTGKAYMSFAPVYTEWHEAIPRIEHYHLTNYTFSGSHMLQKLLNAMMPKRKMPLNLVPVGRSQWFTIAMECMKYIVTYLEQNSKFRQFMKLTWGADEFIFQTILYNSPYREHLVNNNLRYIDWSEGGASPKTLTIKDREHLLASNMLYARKFDLIRHGDVMAAIDKKLDSGITQLESA
jgi:hypothetical protein